MKVFISPALSAIGRRSARFDQNDSPTSRRISIKSAKSYESVNQSLYYSLNESNCSSSASVSNEPNSTNSIEEIRKRNPYAFVSRKIDEDKTLEEASRQLDCMNNNCECDGALSKELHDSLRFESTYASFKDSSEDQTSYEAKDKLIEFVDHYETRIENLRFSKNEILIKYDEFDNQIEVNGFHVLEIEDQVIIDKILLRSFQLPDDVNSFGITSLLTPDKQLILVFPKLNEDSFIGSTKV